MNQGMAGLIIGAIFGLVLGFFLAPTESAAIPGVDGPDLACLEDRQALAAEVRNSLARMADAGCASDEAILEPLPAGAGTGAGAGADEQAPAPVDAGIADPVLEALPTEDVPEPSVPDAGTVPTESKDQAQPNVTANSAERPATADRLIPLEPTPPSRQWMVQLVATPESAEAQGIAKKARNLGLPTVINHELVPLWARNSTKFESVHLTPNSRAKRP